MENTSEKYQLLENELSKILIFKNEGETITLSEARKLLSLDLELDYEDLFFEMFLNRKKIITKTNEIIKNSSDSYLLLQKVKFYINLLIKTKIEILESGDHTLKEKNFPRYLFKHKNSYNELVDRLDKSKAIKCLGLIKKTEILLRKNDNMFLSTTQRFLLNIKKEIN